jgi:hypothetical protein
VGRAAAWPVVAASLDGNQGVLNGEETEGSNGGGVNLVIHCALKVRIEEGRRGRWGDDRRWCWM